MLNLLSLTCAFTRWAATDIQLLIIDFASDATPGLWTQHAPDVDRREYWILVFPGALKVCCFYVSRSYSQQFPYMGFSHYEFMTVHKRTKLNIPC